MVTGRHESIRVAVLRKRDHIRQVAWDLYCADTAGTMDVRDHWSELSDSVQKLYITKAERKVEEEESRE